MPTAQKHQASTGIHGFYHQSLQEIQPYCLSESQISSINVCSDSGSRGTNLSFQAYKEEFCTLESSTTNLSIYDSPSVSFCSVRNPFSTQGSQSFISGHHHSPDFTHESPYSGASSVSDGNTEFKNKLRQLEMSLMSPEPTDTDNFCVKNETCHRSVAMTGYWDQLIEMIPQLDIKQVLATCAQAVSVGDVETATGFMNVLDKMVSISGDPVQRLGAYMLEGLRAKLETTGINIYKALKCTEPSSLELMSYMSVLYLFCPYWKFAYTSANAIIMEATKNEPLIHIIDFQLAQGSQYMLLIEDLAKRLGGPPIVRITALDDSQSNLARGGGLHIIGRKLSEKAKLCGVPFEFHDAAVSACDVELEHLRVDPRYAVAVNFPYVLHHMPDESVSVLNHRDRILRLVKSLSPKIVTLVEQESNTNTAPFLSRFYESLDYYTAMFESIDVARPRDDKQRIRAEQHCVARDIVNMIACEGTERVERHELFGKWRLRFMMAGFTQCPLNSSGAFGVKNMLNEYDKNYKLEDRDGALYLGWKKRDMATSSAWK